MDNTKPQPVSKPALVNIRKNTLLKERLRALIRSKGMYEKEFYKQLGLSKQYWYLMSWGLQEPSNELKCRIAKALDSDSCIIWEERK